METKVGDKVEYYEPNLVLKVKVLGIAKFPKFEIYTFKVVQVIKGENRVGHIFEATRGSGYTCWNIKQTGKVNG